MKNEKKLQTYILDDLRSFGKHCECFKIEKASDNGVPDIFFTTILTGAVLIETKRLDGVASRLQLIRLENLRRCGVQAFVCYSWQQWIAIKEAIGLQRCLLL